MGQKLIAAFGAAAAAAYGMRTLVLRRVHWCGGDDDEGERGSLWVNEVNKEDGPMRLEVCCCRCVQVRFIRTLLVIETVGVLADRIIVCREQRNIK